MASPDKPDNTPASPQNVPPRQDGLRDTIESIVMAFILAFVFRAFIVEAFVIPTGSMAPGLYGVHGEHRCAACQFPFAFGIRADLLDTSGNIVRDSRGMPLSTLSQSVTLRCPNCGYQGEGNKALNSSPETKIEPKSGDRILVLKWPYDIGGETLGPHRWDVVVFKDAQGGEQNYIKRLLGLPGEVLEIINGDLYAARQENVSPEIIEALRAPPQPGGRLTKEQNAELARALKICRPTRVAQKSLWISHYNHDYKPSPEIVGEFGEAAPIWLPLEGRDSPWDAQTPCVRFQPEKDDTAEYRLMLKGKPILDQYGYNNVGNWLSDFSGLNVGDVRVQFSLFPRSRRQGRLTLTLKKGADEFMAKIGANGDVALERVTNGGVPVRLRDAKMEPFDMLQPLEIAFENLNYRVALYVNGDEVVATDDSQYRPDLVKLVQASPTFANAQNVSSITIAAADVALELRHLCVYRDVFYRSDVRLDSSNQLTREQNQFSQYPGWGTQGNPILLRDDPPEYFCCGDNSPQSKDSRLWWEVSPQLALRTGADVYDYGTVPGDQMIGRAFFVYWPGGYRIASGMPAGIPNMGRMRIIR